MKWKTESKLKGIGSTEMIKSIEYHMNIFTNIKETHIIVLGIVPDNKIGHMWPCRYILSEGVMSYVEPYERDMSR